MKLKIVAVGKLAFPFYRDAVEEYLQRVRRYRPCEIVELREGAGKSGTPQQTVEREGEAILGTLSPKAFLVALDERGQSLSSPELARFLEQRMLSGTEDVLAFAIGGAYGLSAAVKQHANFLLSLSALTFPHQMVRPLLLEQLYRGFTIIHHEPYHNGDDFSAGYGAQRRPTGSAHGRRGFPERKTLC